MSDAMSWLSFRFFGYRSEIGECVSVVIFIYIPHSGSSWTDQMCPHSGVGHDSVPVYLVKPDIHWDLRKLSKIVHFSLNIAIWLYSHLLNTKAQY